MTLEAKDVRLNYLAERIQTLSGILGSQCFFVIAGADSEEPDQHAVINIESLEVFERELGALQQVVEQIRRETT